MDIAKYKPTKWTAAAIEAAIVAAQQDAAAIAAAADQAKAARDALLLGDDPQALQQAEDELVTARGNLERFTSVRQQLAERLEVARYEETLARLNERRRELSEANEALNAFWREHGAQLETLMRAGWTVGQRTETAGRAVQMQQVIGIRRYPDDPAFFTPSRDITPVDSAVTPFLEMMSSWPEWLLEQPEPSISQPAPAAPLPKAEWEGSDNVDRRPGRRTRNPVASYFGAGS